jgi:hypothetical protein
LAVAIEVLAVVLLGDRDVVVPRRRRLQAVLVEQVLPVIDHVEVAVERDRVDLAVVGRIEIAEERADVVPLELRIALDPVREVEQIAGTDEIAEPLRVEDVGIERVRLRRCVEQGLVVDRLEADSDHVHVPACESRPVRCPALERLGHLGSVEGQDVDVDTRELLAQRRVLAGRGCGRGCGRCARRGLRRGGGGCRG